MERPIVLYAHEVRAILDGKQTQLRRMVKFTQGGHIKEPRGHRRWHRADPAAVAGCPYGQPGDRLWVKETWEVATGRERGDRLTLEVTGVRVERLQDISEEDARAEGVERNDLIISGFDEGIRYRDYAGNDDMAEWFSDPVRSCRTLWESIHGPGSWDANPWVWVVEFKRVNVEADHA